MSVRIKTRAFVERGVLKYVILSIKGVMPRKELPYQYLDAAPSFWMVDTGKSIKMFSGETISVGGIYRKATFERFMAMIEEAGDRLRMINQEINAAKTEVEKVETRVI
jgi:hypothetical protein